MPTNIGLPSQIPQFVSNPNQMPVAAAAYPMSSANLNGPIVVPSLDPGPALPTLSSYAQSSDSPDAHESAGLTPEQDRDERFKWSEVQPTLLVADKTDYNINEYETFTNSAELNEIEGRVFTFDPLRAGSDTATDIGAFRIIPYQYGEINTKKQIFPKDGRGTGSSGLYYKKMIVTNMGTNFIERSQIIKSNKALHAYFFNDSPEVLSIQGFLKTSSNDPWDIAMVLLWDRLLRATELARHNAILEFNIADVVYWGYPITCSMQLSSNTQFVASFSMQMLIIDKLLPLTNLDDAVLQLTTSIEQTSGFATTSLTVTNDIDIVTPLSSINLSDLPKDRSNNTNPDNLALGQGPLNDQASLAIALAGPGVPQSGVSAIPSSISDMFAPAPFALPGPSSLGGI